MHLIVLVYVILDGLMITASLNALNVILNVSPVIQQRQLARAVIQLNLDSWLLHHVLAS